MARVYEYTRSVDSVTVDKHCEGSQFKLEGVTLICIKQEASNEYDEDTPIPLNDESTKSKPNYMSTNNCNSNKTDCCLTEKESKNNISENRYDNKSTECYSSKKRENRKRKPHERHSVGDKDDLENMKALQESEDNIESYKKEEKAAINRQFRRKCKRRKQTVHCKICFLKFSSLNGLHHHNRSYERKKLRPLTIEAQSLQKGKIVCNFCSRHFKEKCRVQSHLFHLHMSDLGFDVDEKNSLSNEIRNSHSGTPKKQIMRQTTLLEYMVPPEKSKCLEIANTSTDCNFYSQAIIKQEIDLNDNEPDLSTNIPFADTSLQNEISRQAKIPNQPFVKIHVHSSMMEALLGVNPNDSTKPSENNSKNNNSEVYAVGSLNSSEKPSNEEPSAVVNENKQANIGEKLKGQDLLSICKKCTVPLIRCNDKLVTKFPLESSTPTARVSAQNISTSSKRRRQQSRNTNVTITPTLDTPSNATPKNSSSTSSTPKSILSSSTHSKATMLDLYVRSNLSEQFANQRSLPKKTAPVVEKQISSKQPNAVDPVASSFEEKSDLTNIQSTQPTTEFKLKELRVSLIKLPQIKKELDESTIFYCEICEVPFSSEKKRDKHIKKFHTSYISSICTARCKSKRYMLKHYLQEHCIWGSSRCCVCRKFFRNRLSLHRHLLLHCIKVTVSKNEKRSNMTTKCQAVSKSRRRLQTHPVKSKEIADVGQENVNANDVENIASLTKEHKAVNKEKTIDSELQTCQINEAASEIQNALESNVIFLPANSDYEALEPVKEPILDPLYVINDSSISENETRIALTPNLNAVPSNVSNDNKPFSMLSNIIVNPKQRYPCSICGKQFQKLENLWKHKRTYTQSLENFCSTCGLCFSNRKILRNHINSTHDFYLSNLFNYHCQFCNQGFRSETNLRIHELHYHATVETTGKQKVAELLQVSNFENNLNTTETMCSVCGRYFNSYERYQLHCMYYHKGHVFSCHICGQIYQGLYMLHHHNKLHHYPATTRLSYTYQCQICSEGFAIESHFHGHMAHVHPDKQPNNMLDVSFSQSPKVSKKSYVCSKCHLEFSTITELMVHVEHYTDSGNYKCQQCPRKCCTLAVLSDHINLSHGDRLRNDYKCGLCNEVLMSKTSLLCHKKHVHLSMETPEDFTFARRISDPSVNGTESNTHVQTLSVILGPENELCEPQVRTSSSPVSIWGKCNISCPICGVTFDTELFLKKHLTEYLDVGDYKCEMCKRRFANYEYLRKHLANHTRPGMPLTKYYCNVCNENFQSSIVYESHVAHLHASLIVKNI